MKKIKWMLSLLLVAGLAATVLNSCKEDEPPALVLISITADGVDLNTATSAAGVKVGSTIIATFNVPVEEASAGSAITIKRDFDAANFPATVTVNGSEVTITPESDFSTGTLFILNFNAGLKSGAGKTLTEGIERNFTSEGTFAVPGAFAHFTFENNAIDIIAGKAPTANGTVAITYVDGRKADAGKAASFNGTTSIIEYANGDQFVNNGSWTMSLWAKPMTHTDDAGKGHFVLGLGAFFGFQFEMFGSYNGFKLATSYTNGSKDYSEDLWADGEGNLGWQGWTFSKDFTPVGGMNTVVKEKWAHYVFVYNATEKTGTIYLNGEKIKSQDFDNWPDGDDKRTTTGLKYRGVAPEVVNELALGFVQSRAGTLWDAEPWGGYDQASANHYKGLMDDLIFYKKALTVAEVTAMYNSGK